MLIDVSDDFIIGATEQEEASIRADITRIAWNIAILPKHKRNPGLKRYLKKVSKYAPDQEAIDSLKDEMARIIKRKVEMYPSLKNKIQKVEVIRQGNSYTIRAYHYGNNTSNKGFTD